MTYEEIKPKLKGRKVSIFLNCPRKALGIKNYKYGFPTGNYYTCYTEYVFTDLRKVRKILKEYGDWRFMESAEIKNKYVTIGTCEHCQWWDNCGNNTGIGYCHNKSVEKLDQEGALPLLIPKDFGCIHWQKKEEK